MIKYIFYGIYNLVYQVTVFWLLLFLGTYFNQAFIPDSLMWKDDKPRTDTTGLTGAATIETLVLLIETSILILLIYFINRLFLNHSFGKNLNNKVLIWTVRINVILSICFIGILIWGGFRKH
jgi:hypothetical protein